MKKITQSMVLGAAALLACSGLAQAAVVTISSDIATSTRWTADNTYKLVGQIFVLPGATLTIDAGVVVASDLAAEGSLAVCSGAKIYVNGTETDPVIMTSTADVATWTADATHPTGKNPKSGTWRQVCNEWGNLTLMGKGLIGASSDTKRTRLRLDGTPNTKVPDGLNVVQMEGLVAVPGFESRVYYGGNDDNDDSGSIRYLSIRYGGKVLGLANELNGLSLGGIGRETDLEYIEIMNNVDDGIEIWGGTVNLKYFSIWNIGDDSLDIDQGWRGKAQFGLIVQGYSVDASQGSGVGDNMFEFDGAEDSDAQPLSTVVLYNCTAIGQPNPSGGDHATAWRDNARAQFRNCIFMDVGERLVKNDNKDGDGGSGYGNGQLSWADTWITNHNVWPTLNIGTADPTVLYTAMTDGKLAEITDSVLFNIAGGLGDAPVNLLDAVYNNVSAGASPILALQRESAGVRNMLNVVHLDPRANNNALTSVAVAPNNGFFTPAPYRGAFNAMDNWLVNWTAACAFGKIKHVEPTVAFNSINQPEVSFSTVTGRTYTVQQSTDMVNWTVLASVGGTGAPAAIVDSNPLVVEKYYRVVVQ